VIQVNRNAKPKVLEDNAKKWTTNYLAAKKEYEADKTNSAKKNNFKKAESKYNHEDVKLALRNMFFEKCAYCESNTTHVSYGEIEHFKPKSKYPELCFEWRNMNFSCEICNGKAHKGDKFPLENENGPIIDPVEENPDNHFKFIYDKEWDQAIVIPIGARAETTVSMFKLNDRKPLYEKRTKRVKEILIIKTIADKGNQEAKNLLESLSPKDEYYAFIKSIIQST
jgi:uncharacterized protein (TIGR02646 family)